MNVLAGRTGLGWVLALGAAAAFGLSGSFATPLIRSGWSPGAVVLARVSVAAIILLGPALVALRGRFVLLRRNAGLIAGYGLVAIAACQLFYFSALATLDVSVALLLEFLGIVLVVGWLWLRHGQRPRFMTVVGSILALFGLVLVLKLLGGGVHVDLLGTMWGLLSAIGLAAHFILSARPAFGLPSLALAASGLSVGALALWVVGMIGIMPLHAEFGDVAMAGKQVPWWLLILGVGVISAALAYVMAIAAVRALGSKLASFIGLAEVLFAVLFAWLLLGQMPTAVQLLGGALIVTGVLFVRADELRGVAALPPKVRS